MDVAVGTTDVPLSRKVISLLGSWLLLIGIQAAYAVQGERPLHSSADREVWDRKTNRVELFGNAVVRQPSETLTADYIVIDFNARTLDAKRNVVYMASDTMIYGEEMHFNLDTRTGSIINGRVANDRFTLSGERINKLGDSRYQTHWGEYSTCRDCPRSWLIQAEDVDMQIEGYAYMSNVTPKIKDAPAMWFPYLIVPMKTRRQTGLLFPRFGFSGNNGAHFVLPFFWAINRGSDMTFGLGDYTLRGRRLEWEGRYALSSKSSGQANFYFQNDKTFGIHPNRWAVTARQSQELPFGIQEKFKVAEVSDNLYPTAFFDDLSRRGDLPTPFSSDVMQKGDPVLTSDLIFDYASSDVSAYIAAKRFRNLLNASTDPNPTAQDELRLTQFDPSTVQVAPTAVVTTNDNFLFGSPVAAGLTFGVTHFNRSGPDYDYTDESVPFGTDPGLSPPAFVSGQDPLRKATRLSVTPSLYTTLRPFEVLSIIPSLKYFYYAYSFPSTPQNPVSALYRGYLLFQTDLSTQLERIYDNEDPNVPRTKHLIRPLLTYSYIPSATLRSDNNHPFIRQIDYAQSKGFSGFNFDNYDLVPIDSSPSTVNYYMPLGNSLAYGFTSQLIERRGKVDLEEKEGLPTYRNTVELSAGQAINFREYQKGTDPVTGLKEPRPLTRFFSNLNLSFDQISSSTTYTYTPYIPGDRNTLSTSWTYIFERAMHQRILTFDRSVVLGYSYSKLNLPGTSSLSGTLNFSLSDYVLPTFNTTFDAIGHRFLSNTLKVVFQSPSQCWLFSLLFGRSVSDGSIFGVDFALNLTGSGYGGVTELTTQAMTQ